MTIFEKNYQLLLKIIPTLFEIKTAAKLQASGFMPLNVDILSKEPKNYSSPSVIITNTLTITDKGNELLFL